MNMRYEPMKQAMEAELFANPDDEATHRAYADWLQEHGDVAEQARGEFISVQLALEEADRDPQERARWKAREKQLLDTYQHLWLGELAPFLLEGEEPAYIAAHNGHETFPVFTTTRPPWLPEGEPFEAEANPLPFHFRRGWLDVLHVRRLSLYLARALRDSPIARLLHTLTIDEVADSSDPAPLPGDNVPERMHSIGLGPLVAAPFLRHLRRFRLGPDDGDDYRMYNCHIHASVIAEMVAKMEHIEELFLYANDYDLNAVFASPTLSHLRILKVYHRGQVHRLQLLAENPTAGNLTHLQLHPHNANAWHWNSHIDDPAGYRAEEGYLPLSVVQPFLRSRNFPHLRHLQLRCSSMGDAGVRELVTNGWIERLETLDLRHGCITNEGARLLAACPALRDLTLLDLDRNQLTAAGRATLEATGVMLRAENQQTPREVANRYANYLTEGEFE
jgi:uncharacterized protein (TIGR02996 family)